MFSWLTLLSALYIGGRFILLLPFPFALRLVLFVLVMMVAECHTLYKWLFASQFAPEFPHSMMVIINWLFGSLLFFTLCLLTCDLLAVTHYALQRQWQDYLTLRSLLFTVSLLIFGYATWQAIKLPEVKTVKLKIANLPAAFAGYRLVQLTDLHASTLFHQAWMQKVVERTNQLHADAIVFTGDIADGSVERRYADVAPLADLRATQGCYAIPGNHEYYSDFTPWMARMTQLGFKNLINQSVALSRAGQQIILAGVTDQVALRFQQAGPDLDLALAGVDRQQTIILLDHRPENARDNLAAGVDLQLSGHTHGGMLYGLDQLVKRANHGFYSGLYSVNNRQLYVSNGTGIWNGFALRLGHPSEITLFILEP